MPVNKVVYNTENGPQTLIDLTGDSVTPEALAEGATAHDASGNVINGVGKTTSVLYTEQTLTDEQKAQARANIGAMAEPTIKRQYVKKSNITNDYFWFWYEGLSLPYEHAYEGYSLVEPLVLDAGTYYLSAVEHAYSWIVFSDGALQRISDYEPVSANHTDFVLTLTERCTLYLGYHTPTQVSATAPYVIEGSEPLKNGEYFEGEYSPSLESISPYNRFVNAYIKNGELVANELRVTHDAIGHYTGVRMDGNITQMRCRAKFVDKCCVALVTTNRGSSEVVDITLGSIHLVFGHDGCAVGVFDINGGESLRSVVYYTYTVPIDLEVPFGFDINEATNTLTVYLPDGTTKTVTDSVVSNLNGRYAIWEHFMNKLDRDFDCCKITKLYCRDTSGEVLNDDLRRFDGAIGVAPTGQVYRQFVSGSSREFK